MSRWRLLCAGLLVAGLLFVGVPVAGASVSRQAAAPAGVPLPQTGPDHEWWFPAWQIPRVWALGARGQGVTIAVMDSGVNAARPELAGHVLRGTDFVTGVGDGRTDADAPDGHGTAMAMFIAGQGGPSGEVGIAPDAQILPVVRGGVRTTLGVQIRWAVDHGAKVINMSFGGAVNCTNDDEVMAAVRYAVDRGDVLVAASGNEGIGHVASPANCPGVLAVGAVDLTLGRWNESNHGPELDVVAPGVHMRTLNLAGQQGFTDGTSDAAALTSGAVALVWSKFPRLTNRQVVARILATVRDVAPAGRDDYTGYGAVRPYQAITANVPLNAPNPVFDRLDAVLPPGGAVASPKPGVSASASPGVAVPGSGRIAGLPKSVAVLILVLVVLGGLVVLAAGGIAFAMTRRRPPPPTSAGPYPPAPSAGPYQGQSPPPIPPTYPVPPPDR